WWPLSFSGRGHRTRESPVAIIMSATTRRASVQPLNACGKCAARRSGRNGLSALRRDAPDAAEDVRHDHPADEPADVSEESDAATVGRRAEEPEVRFEQLIQEPEAEEEPG